MLRIAVLALLLAACWGHAASCPSDVAPRAGATLLTVQLPQRPATALTAGSLAAWPAVRLVQRRTVSSGSAVEVEQGVVYEGVLLRDVLAGAGLAEASERGLRTHIVEAVATDGYRAIFSWGEVFNHAAGEQIVVIRSQDGQALGASTGPLALRALADLRPGPRHVRNLCALILRLP